jgi:serine/threonine-protein kinase HipA
MQRAEREGRAVRTQDGDHCSYPELVDILTQYGAEASTDAQQLYRRMVFNVMISNVDDHLRNHGFLWKGPGGWTLSPVYDLSPPPIDVHQRIWTTNIGLDDATCDLDLVLSVAEYFGLAPDAAKAIIKAVAAATATWREVAAANKARPAEIRRVASAFEHDDLKKALAL